MTKKRVFAIVLFLLFGTVAFGQTPTPTRDIKSEQKLHVLAVSTFFAIGRAFYRDIPGLNKSMDSDDIFKETAAEFPEYAFALTPLSDLKNLPTAKRLALITRSEAAMQKRLTASEKWEFKVGMEMGGLVGPIFLATSGDRGLGDAKIAPAPLRIRLLNIQRLTRSAPRSFPRDVLSKLKELAAERKNVDLKTEIGLLQLLSDVMSLLETISPTVVKKDN